ncbi:MAG: precorrin-6A reductase [Candidatus Caldatribacteriaceae bacterium]
MILLLGGTTEGRVLSQVLKESSYPFWVSVASPLGREFLPGGIAVRSGPFSEESLEVFIRKEGIRVIVDATHPFAQEIKGLAQRVARKMHIPYLCYERPGMALPASVHRVKTVAEALDCLRSHQRIFLALGIRHLAPFVALKEEGKTIRVRVLPTSASLKRCEELGLSPQEVVALCGPASTELNWILFREFGAQVVVSKDSGREGGLWEKVEATSRLGIPLLLLERPWRDGGERFQDVSALLARLGELYGL